MVCMKWRNSRYRCRVDDINSVCLTQGAWNNVGNHDRNEMYVEERMEEETDSTWYLLVVAYNN